MMQKRPPICVRCMDVAPPPAAKATRPHATARRTAPEPQIVVRQPLRVERLAYTRSQAAEALGIGRTTLTRLLPYIDTIETPWGTTLIPVDELERLLAERRQRGASRLGPTLPAVPRRSHRSRRPHPIGTHRRQDPRPDRAGAQREWHNDRARWQAMVAFNRPRHSPARGPHPLVALAGRPMRRKSCSHRCRHGR